MNNKTKQALEQPAQKRPQNCGTGYCSCIECVMEPAQQEPEYWLWACGQHIQVSLKKPEFPDAIPLYTSPPQRKPLTEQEIGAILEDINAFGTRLYTFARAIEAAHGIKEKNNG